MRACGGERPGQDRARKFPFDHGVLTHDGPWYHAGRGHDPAPSLAGMETATSVPTLWPWWMRSAGLLAGSNSRVRTRCPECGALMRVDLADIVARYGGDCSLIDRRENCRLVECTGQAFYLAQWSYGQAWRILLTDREQLDDIATLPTARTAAAFDR